MFTRATDSEVICNLPSGPITTCNILLLLHLMQSVPRHCFPSALKPDFLQSQIYEPTVLMHSVKYGHTSLGLAHSSISENDAHITHQ